MNVELDLPSSEVILYDVHQQQPSLFVATEIVEATVEEFLQLSLGRSRVVALDRRFDQLPQFLLVT